MHVVWVGWGESENSVSDIDIGVLCEIKRSVLLFLGLFGFLFNSLIVDLLDGIDSGGKLSGDLDEEGHSVLHQSESPGEFHNDVWSDQLVGGIETGSEVLLLVLLNEESEQFLNKLSLSTFLSSLNTISIFLVLHGDLHGDLVLLGSSVEESSNSSELGQLVVLALLGKSGRVEGGVGGDRLLE